MQGSPLRLADARQLPQRGSQERKGALSVSLTLDSSPEGRAKSCLRRGLFQSIVVFVRPTPMTAVVIFFQVLQPQTPSTRRLVRRW